ncbi:hypothetical protein OXPF_27800 [Oxobacter pfennigii]|uniref:DUF2292 domain-containing protein n=1 Tax=Oxobacter pfennigii TaxID=36849 RepID=A0A0P8W424_9CLOT|nr:DUF2292 domain-containing protein [Oxobacter pfennigii]KPU43339.1 hypothetical protein OXPF_27800 [Oxobacter pfennigii]
MAEVGQEMEVTQKEKKLIELIRALQYGEITIMVVDKQPMEVEEVRKSTRF